MAVHELVEKIIGYIGSEDNLYDCELSKKELSNGGTGWIDIGHRFEFPQEFLKFREDGFLLSFFDLTLDMRITGLENFKRKLVGTATNNDDIIDGVIELCKTKDYKKLKENKRGKIFYNRFAGFLSYPRNVSIAYNKPLVDYMLNINISCKNTIADTIKMLNSIDDDIYEIGEVFQRGIPEQYARFFRLYKDPGTKKYCIRFDYCKYIDLCDIDPRLPLIFTKKRKIYVNNAEELETMMGLAGMI